MIRTLGTLTAVLATTLALLVGCGSAEAGPVDPAGTEPAPARVVDPVKVVAVGDIACLPGEAVTPTTCKQRATARLAARTHPAYVLALGDNQYDSGRLAEYRGSYDRSWGALKGITRPLPGNHEYRTVGARGYYRYFDRHAPGYYAWNAGSWRIYNLNSNCAKIDCAAETRWLRRDLEANPRVCSAIAMHHPRYSSGSEHGSDPSMRRFWDVATAHHVDVALAGHDHDYERFARLDGSGYPTQDGLLSFVSGAGGKSLYPLADRHPASRYADDTRFGVLVLSLGVGEFGWKYKTIDGVVRDSGSRSCVA